MAKLERYINKSGDLYWTCLGGSCPENCCQLYQGRKSSFVSVFGIEHDEVLLSQNEADMLISKGYGEHVRFGESNWPCIRLLPDRSCPFLSSGLCSIQDIKPSICRAYPLYFDLFVGLCIDSRCPGVDVGTTSIDIVRNMIRALIEVYHTHMNRIITRFSLNLNTM